MRRLSLLARIVLAAVLLAAALLKLRSLRATAAALATYDVPAPLRSAAVGLVVSAEAAVAAGLLAGETFAAYAGAAVLGVFALATTWALLRGRRGAPCGCFGTRSRVGTAAVARNVVLAGALAAVPSVPHSYPGTTGWLALALAVAFVCIVALGVAVVALTREVGLLHLRLPPAVALDIADEGPAVGTRVQLAPGLRAPLTLAVFSSAGCRLCRALEPVVASFQADSALAVTVYDEVQDADVWRRLGIPGSPYAVALDEQGEVRAKGTFNSYGQLEAIVTAAEQSLAAVA